MDPLKIIAVENLPLITKGDNLAELICNAAREQNTPIQDGDILVITHVAVSKAEGDILNLDEIVPSERAREIALRTGKDPALVEAILRETKEIVRLGPNSIITEIRNGMVCANAGVDRSNVGGERNVALLPKNPDTSAQKIRQEVKRLTGCDIAVIISDTHGRPFRMGEVNVAIGVAGIRPLRDRRGEKDLFGYVLKVKRTAVADELASAAELVMGQADEGIPAAIIRGYKYQRAEDATITELVRPREKDLFR
ncbi:MAG: coenzyme F420-0:L-glutamate ligase [Candidatus Bathyarchaeota archaeon]|nr:coenzyme F420-0:L-glutamate ligase [Candidatus Bathyarchaeota archaeon]